MSRSEHREETPRPRFKTRTWGTHAPPNFWPGPPVEGIGSDGCREVNTRKKPQDPGSKPEPGAPTLFPIFGPGHPSKSREGIGSDGCREVNTRKKPQDPGSKPEPGTPTLFPIFGPGHPSLHQR